MLQEDLHSGDPLPCRTNVSPLPPICPPGTGKTIIGSKNNGATAQDIYIGRPCADFLQNRPTDRTVADIEAEMQIGSRIAHKFFLAPKSSPKSVTTKKRRVGVLGGRQFFGATLKILALAAQIGRK
jgi:hypothetical protein